MMSQRNTGRERWRRRWGAGGGRRGASGRAVQSILLLTIGCLMFGALPALDPAWQLTQYGVKSWGPEDGLSTGAVRALAQTADGWLWVGTDDGLYRFDGIRFERIAAEPGPDVTPGAVTALQVGRASDLWIGTRDIGLLEWRDGRLARPPFALGRGNPEITALVVDPDGALWAGTRDRGVFRWRDGRLTPFTTADGLPSNMISGLGADSRAGVWVSTADGRLMRLGGGAPEPLTPPGPGAARNLRMALRDRRGGLWLGIAGAEVDGASGEPVESVLIQSPDGACYEISTAGPGYHDRIQMPPPILEDRHGTIWFGTRRGVFRVSGGRMEILDAANGLPDNRVICLLADREDNLWIGTALGLVRLREEAIVTFGRTQGLRSDRVLAVTEGKNRHVWAGTDNGLNKITGSRVAAFKAQELSGAWVYDILPAPEGGLWLATRQGLIRARDDGLAGVRLADGRPPGVVHAVCADRDGAVWAGTAGHGVARVERGALTAHRGPIGSPLNQVFDLSAAPGGGVWAATRGGVARLHDGALRPAGPDGVETVCLHADADGTVWAGTAGAGLLRLQDGRIRSVTKRQGLWHDTVLGIVDDGAGNLWMASPQGIFRASQRQLHAAADGQEPVVCVHYGIDDGMRSLECLPGGCRSSDGRLWFCTSRGLCVVQPERLLDPPPPPPVHLLGITADNQAMPSGGRTVAPGVRDLEFHFAALNYRDPEKVRFRCRLDGFHAEWSAPFADRRVRYAALPPGDYTLRLQARLRDGAWGPDALVVPFTVRAPLWRTTWFQVAALLALAAAVLAGRAAVQNIRRLLREWRAGHQVGPYRLVERIGQGGMGTVWRAVHRQTGKEAAVKILEPASDDDESRRRFIREGLACERIDHPAVVRVFGRGEDQGRLWYAMEFCRGRSLRASIPPEGLPPRRAVEVFRQLLAAVEAIHAAGVMHRDLKPDNVFLVPAPPAEGEAATDGAVRVRVLDFGLARPADQRTRTGLGVPAGTIAYLPPEYLGSGGREDAGVDAYALGVILYEMLTGVPPFAGAADDPAGMLYAVLSEEPVPPAEVNPDVPAALSELTLAMIAREPARRLADSAAIRARLDRIESAASEAPCRDI